MDKQLSDQMAWLRMLGRQPGVRRRVPLAIGIATLAGFALIVADAACRRDGVAGAAAALPVGALLPCVFVLLLWLGPRDHATRRLSTRGLPARTVFARQLLHGEVVDVR